MEFINKIRKISKLPKNTSISFFTPLFYQFKKDQSEINQIQHKSNFLKKISKFKMSLVT